MNQVFAALGDPTRLTLVRRLSLQDPQPLGHLVAGLPVTRQAATRHLHVLRDAGLVRVERVGREQRCSLDTRRLEAAERFLAELEATWDARLARLDALLNGLPSGGQHHGQPGDRP